LLSMMFPPCPPTAGAAAAGNETPNPAKVKYMIREILL
jgi:hypothetical protein